MHFLGLIQLPYVVSGFCVGVLVGMTGVGGGSLTTPLLILLFGVNPATAVGTDLLFAATTKTVGTLIHGVSRTIDWLSCRAPRSRQRPSNGGNLAGTIGARFQGRGSAPSDHHYPRRRP